MKRLAGDAGFTLVEIMVATVILLAGVLGALTLLNGANAATSSTKAREGATNLAREVIEAARGVQYDDLLTATLVSDLQNQPELADSSAASGWQVERRNREYTINLTACRVDDGSADGFGDHTGLSFCSDSTGTGTADSNPDDYRRVAVEVSWTIGGDSGKVRQEAVINNPGSAYATGIRSLTPTSPSLSLPYTVTSPSTTSITFTAQTTGIPSLVRWYQDNLFMDNATGSGTTWTFTWNLSGVVDGTYVISAEAFDADGESGPGKADTIVLNRFPPGKPTGLAAGLNGSFGTEFEWNPNPERDITGYRVYRQLGSSPNPSTDLQVCETGVADPTPTSCTKTGEPSPATYYVVALAPARPPSTGTELSQPSDVVTVDSSNLPPNPPQSVQASRSDGIVTVTWQAPADPAAGEASDTLRYYRIYRNGLALSNRVDTTGSGSQLSWVDFNAGPTTNTYYVTAVDSHMAESAPAPSGGVTG